jgi:hypothetical protein
MRKWKRARWYVGHCIGSSKLQAFKTFARPTEDSHGHLYTLVTGPFATRRGAAYMVKNQDGSNPHLRSVNEAEKAAAKAAKIAHPTPSGREMALTDESRLCRHLRKGRTGPFRTKAN